MVTPNNFFYNCEHFNQQIVEKLSLSLSVVIITLSVSNQEITCVLCLLYSDVFAVQ